MSKHYITCARCDKDIEITHYLDCYSSEIDGKLICKECFQKEQPRELINQIKEKDNIIKNQREGILYWKSIAEKRPDFNYVVKIKDLENQILIKDKEIEGRKKLCDLRYEQLKEAHREKIKSIMEELQNIKNFINRIDYIPNANDIFNFVKNRIEEFKKEEI